MTVDWLPVTGSTSEPNEKPISVSSSEPATCRPANIAARRVGEGETDNDFLDDQPAEGERIEVDRAVLDDRHQADREADGDDRAHAPRDHLAREQRSEDEERGDPGQDQEEGSDLLLGEPSEEFVGGHRISSRRTSGSATRGWSSSRRPCSSIHGPAIAIDRDQAQDLRDEGERLLLDLRHGLQDRDQQAHDQADEEHRQRDLHGHAHHVHDEGDDLVLAHDMWKL